MNVQLYSLRSEQNWGIGDFGDLATLIEQSAKQGADYVGINPLHLPYPAVPNWASPYSSSSRRWLNFLYLDIPDLPEFKRCRSVQNWFKREDIQAKIAALRESDCVDYSSILALKLTALESLFDFFQRSQSVEIVTRRKIFAEYLKTKVNLCCYRVYLMSWIYKNTLTIKQKKIPLVGLAGVGNGNI